MKKGDINFPSMFNPIYDLLLEQATLLKTIRDIQIRTLAKSENSNRDTVNNEFLKLEKEYKFSMVKSLQKMIKTTTFSF